MPTFAEMTQQKQQAPQGASLRWGGGGGPYVEKPEEGAKWRSLVAALPNVGAEVDLRVKFVGLKTPVDVHGWDDNLKRRVLKYPNAKGTQGCRLTLEVVEPGLEGLRFYPDGAYTGGSLTALGKTLVACAGRAFADDEDVNPHDYIGREFILTVALGKPVAPKEDGSHTNKGGHYWNIRGYRQLPVKVSFGQQAYSDVNQRLMLTNPPEAGGSTVPVRADDLDDLSDVPF
jgi:hypothetical protein